MATSKSRYAESDAASKAFNNMPLLSSSDAHSAIEVHLSATDLKNMDTFSKSDPFARVVLVRTGKAEVELGRTEVIPNTLSPSWTIGIRLDYHFEEIQTLRVEVYDEDKVGSDNLNDHQMQGSCMLTVGQLMTAPDSAITKDLFLGKSSMMGGQTLSKAGTVTLRAEELVASSEFLQLGIRGKSLANKDGFFSKSDPYFEILKVREDGTWIPVYRSIYLKNTLNPVWPTAKRISIQTICNGDYDRPLRIEVFDMDNDGSHDDMGRTETNVRQLLHQGTIPITKQTGLPVVETLKNGKKKNSGSLYVDECGIMKYDTFVDFIQSGWELNMMIAVDFTGSNGNPADPRSLHYRSGVPGQFNQYEQAIQCLGEVISQYDHDGLYPAYGFGAKNSSGQVSHCFPLNGNPGNPYVQGVSGILSSYATSLTQWGLSGPTIFSQIINAAAALAKSKAPDPRTAHTDDVGDYTILLILTDGIITDLEQTKEAIVAASKLALSIIIIGVGEADFSAMDALDADEVRLQDQHGRVASRDIVQFVKFNDFVRGAASSGGLAGATLEELPAQMLGYFNDNNIRPRVKTGCAMSAKTDGQVAIDAAIGTELGASNMLPPPPGAGGGGKLMNVTVPVGASGGMELGVTIADGREMVVKIPMGMNPGQVFQVNVPDAPRSNNDLAALGKGLLAQNLNA